jgi:hypothetical protein
VPSTVSGPEVELVGTSIEGERLPVHLFRAMHPSAHRSMLACAAPIDLVISVYGGDGIGGKDGLMAAFGGVGVFKNDDTGQRFLSVWGPRKAEIFLAALRASGADIEVVRRPPPARLVLYTATNGTHRMIADES